MSGTEPIGELGQLARFDTGPHLGEDVEAEKIHGAEDFRPLNKHRIIARRFFRNKLAVLGLCILILVVLF